MILAGWAASLLVVQAVHLVTAVTAAVAISVFAAGIVMALAFSQRKRSAEFRGMRASLAMTASFVVMAVWVVSRGMAPIENFDTGLYHLPTIRWINDYAIVPGLGNLHGRLAFNQSFFTWVASLDAAWFGDNARGAANGFLFLVIAFQVVEALRARLTRDGSHLRESPLTWAAHLALVPALGYVGLSTEGFTSPTPDLAAALLQLSMFLMFVQGAGEWSTGGRPSALIIRILPLIGATAITVKLSTIAFTGTLLLACLLYRVLYDDRRSGWLTAALPIVAPAAAVMAVWAVRGVILSGCPVYPTTTGCLSVDWAVPTAKVVNEANWVYSWARQPGIPWRFVLADWGWLDPWLARESRDLIGFVFPLASAAILIPFAFVARMHARRKRIPSVTMADFSILLPIILGITFWFFTAPDARFGRAFFWMLSASGAVLMLHSLRFFMSDQRYRNAVIAILLLVSAPFLGYIVTRGPARIMLASTSGWHDVPQPPLAAMATSSGLILNVPPGERCWNAPLPCTPYFNKDLELRQPGRMERGFADRSPSGGRALSRPP